MPAQPKLTKKALGAIELYVDLNSLSPSRKKIVELVLHADRLPRASLYKELRDDGFVWDDGAWRERKRWL